MAGSSTCYERAVLSLSVRQLIKEKSRDTWAILGPYIADVTPELGTQAVRAQAEAWEAGVGFDMIADDQAVDQISGRNVKVGEMAAEAAHAGEAEASPRARARYAVAPVLLAACIFYTPHIIDIIVVLPGSKNFI